MNKHQVKGRIQKAKGSVRELAGMITGDRTMEREGRVGKTLGGVQARYGDVKESRKKGN